MSEKPNQAEEFINAIPKEEEIIEVELSNEQKIKVINCWNSRPENDPPSLKELCVLCFGASVDGRDKRSKALKKFLAERSLKAKVSYIYHKKGELELTNEQKEYVANNAATHSCLEMAETLFDKKLTNLSQETRAVINFARTLTDRVQYSDPKDLETGDYKAPKLDSSMIDRVNKYVDDPIDKINYSKNDRQKRYIKALLTHINSYRFIQQINTYSSKDDRELFESTFINYVYKKDDLTPEERDQYIMLCTDTVTAKHILKRIDMFQSMADEVVADNDNQKRAISMSVVETISNLRKEYNDCVKRTQSLMDDLTGKRSSRIKDQHSGNESLASLVEFMRTEETRKRLANFAKMRQKELAEEVKKLEDMDALKIEIFGISAEEVIN